jgi:putative ABC transport system ATP-binding protein
MTTPLITARGVSKSYQTAVGVVTPVVDFDLTLEPGQLVVLHGASGSGKTTIVHLLAGWEQPDRGAIAWPGTTSPSWSEVAVVPQTLALLDELTVAENITLPLRATRSPRMDAGLAQVLEELNLVPLLDRPVDQISVGEQQRVMIARALATRPAVILADEPTVHQDDRNATAIAWLLQQASRAGAACLIATRQTTLRGLVDQAGTTHRQQPDHLVAAPI